MLCLHDNQLSTLPAGMDRMANLASLDISYNQISTLPLGLPYAPCLTELKSKGNPISSKAMDKAMAIVEARASGQQVPAPYMEQLRVNGTKNGNGHLTGSSSSSADTRPGQLSGTTASQAGGQARLPDSGQPQESIHEPDVLVVRQSSAEMSQQLSRLELADADLPEIIIHGQEMVHKDNRAASGAQGQQEGLQDTGSVTPPVTGAVVQDISELPPACAAVMYRTLTAAQEGLRELQEGRPLSRGGTAVGATRVVGLTMPRTDTISRAGTSRAARPPTSMAAASVRPPSRQVHSGVAAWTGTGSNGNSSGYWASAMGAGGHLEGVRALLASSSSSQGGRPSTSVPGLPPFSNSVSRGTSSVSQAIRAAPVSDTDGVPALESLPAVTFPLTAGVRGMLRQMSGSRARSGTPDSMQGLGGALEHTPVTCTEQSSQDTGHEQEDSDALVTVQQLLAARNPALLASLQMASQQPPEEEEEYVETGSDGEEG